MAMQGTYKRFDNSLFKANDTQAREAVTAYLKRNKWIVYDNPDRYGPDLMIQTGKNEEIDYVEVEIKQCFLGDPNGAFPYDTIQLPERKAKYRTYNNISFWILSKDLKWAVVIPGDALKYKRPKIVATKYTKVSKCPHCGEEIGERFWQIPLDECEIIHLEGK